MAVAFRSAAPEDFSASELARIENTTHEIGREIFDRLQRRQPSVLERRWWDDRIMAWAMEDEAVKVQMFRFIDVLPMLTSSEAVTRHLQEYLDPVRDRLPAALRMGVSLARPGSLTGRAVAIAARRNALAQARRFIAGTNLPEVLAAAMRERKLKRAFTLDILGEAVTSEVEAERYFHAYLDLIRGTAPTVNAWPELPQIDCGLFASLPRVNVSIKLSALDSQFDPIDPFAATQNVGPRLREILRTARDHHAFVHVDMESYRTKDLTLHIFQQILAEDEFRSTSDVGIVIQCYLKDAERDLLALRAWAEQRGTPVWVRLVKGAYWDYETIYAQLMGWPVPVFEEKWQTDANYERCERFVIQNHRYLLPALGSHNLRSLAHGMAVARHVGLPQSGLELQMLYGMADSEKQVLVDMGYRMRIYMPYGELIPGMAYLVRRLLENTSNDSFLKASFTESASVEELLMNPLQHGKSQSEKPSPPRPAESPLQPAFRNEPPADFSQQANRDAMRLAIRELHQKCGHENYYPLHIGGRDIDTPDRIERVNPSHKDSIVGTIAAALPEHVDLAVASAKAALPAWSRLGVNCRAEYLRAAAAVMRRRRFELAAWQVLECGKPWREADADVCEAIDFCEYYAAGAIALEQPQGAELAGEHNRFEYLPRGVTGVISPWNFPLAILTGMTTAALATGNTVVMKPAEQSSVTAAKLMEIFREVELPAGVANYLPGRGEIAGACLVEHPDVATIAFTGSRQVGLAINARAAQLSTTGAGGVKHVIAEMGGKNAIIVDDDADLDEAVIGVVKSAFGYQGQKCSACSRAIVLAGVYDAFLERLAPAALSLQPGSAEDPDTFLGPVIDEEALANIERYIEIGLSEGRLALSVDASGGQDIGYYVGPHIFADVDAKARIAQEEIFGPVLAVIKAKDFDDAIRICNDTEYALTGGVFSRSPEHLERARREIFVGNLYLNRGITGALVGRQPFGGFKMSGIGTKAGGPDYLLQFVLPRTITENTLRRGFAPTAGGDADVEQAGGV